MDLQSTATGRRVAEPNRASSRERARDTKSVRVTVTNYELQAQPTTHHADVSVPRSNATNEIMIIPENNENLIVMTKYKMQARPTTHHANGSVPCTNSTNEIVLPENDGVNSIEYRTMTNYKMQACSSFPCSNATNEVVLPENDDDLIVYRIKEDGSLCIENLREESASNGAFRAEDLLNGCGEQSFSYMVSDRSGCSPVSGIITANSTRTSFAFPMS